MSDAEDTAFQKPVDLADLAERTGRRHVRAGRATPDFTFATPIVKQKVVRLSKLADEEHEAQMAKVRALSAVERPVWLFALIWLGTLVLTVGAAAAAAAFFLR
jgi:hypothetical protein